MLRFICQGILTHIRLRSDFFGTLAFLMDEYKLNVGVGDL